VPVYLISFALLGHKRWTRPRTV